MLNELDKEMEARGLEFVRYADDCIIMVGKQSDEEHKQIHRRKAGIKGQCNQE